MTATRQLVMEGVWVVGQQNADIADTLQLRDVAMASWQPFLSFYVWVYIGATWQIRLNRPCVAAMRPYVKLLWPLVIVIAMAPALTQTVLNYAVIYIMWNKNHSQ